MTNEFFQFPFLLSPCPTIFLITFDTSSVMIFGMFADGVRDVVHRNGRMCTPAAAPPMSDTYQSIDHHPFAEGASRMYGQFILRSKQDLSGKQESWYMWFFTELRFLNWHHPDRGSGRRGLAPRVTTLTIRGTERDPHYTLCWSSGTGSRSITRNMKLETGTFNPSIETVLLLQNVNTIFDLLPMTIDQDPSTPKAISEEPRTSRYSSKPDRNLDNNNGVMTGNLLQSFSGCKTVDINRTRQDRCVSIRKVGNVLSTRLERLANGGVYISSWGNHLSQLFGTKIIN